MKSLNSYINESMDAGQAMILQVCQDNKHFALYMKNSVKKNVDIVLNKLQDGDYACSNMVDDLKKLNDQIDSIIKKCK